MLIIEGADGVGKTTFAKKVIERLHERCWHAMYRQFGLLPRGWDYYRDYLPHINTKAVMDRFHLSEIAYGETIREGTKLRGLARQLLLAELKLRGAFVLLIAPSREWLKSQLVLKPKNEVFKPDQILAVNQRFRGMLEEPIERTWIDREWTDDSYPDDGFALSIADRYLSHIDEMRRVGVQL